MDLKSYLCQVFRTRFLFLKMFYSLLDLTCILKLAKLEPDFFWPQALFPIANYDNMRLFHTLREPEIISDLGAHLSMPFYYGGKAPLWEATVRAAS